MTTSRSLLNKSALYVVIGAIFAGWSASAAGTALDDYVAAPDPNYTHSLVSTIPGLGYTAYVLDMTSQVWRTPAEVDRTEWHHWLTIIKPYVVSSDIGLLWIDGGDNGGDPPTEPEEMLATVAVLTNTIVADLRMVPNQPLTFADETESRREDAIIAYTFDKYMTTGDGTWPLLLPMVKSAVRAMDTVQAYVSTLTSGLVHVDEFVVSGASKRGWTTWLTAAVDPRVTAIMPLVIDVLNLDEQMYHHYDAYGFYSPAIQDYVDLNIMDRLGTPEGQALLTIVDPYEYRQRYAELPKYGVNSTGDQFFLPDSAQFYFDDLPGEKHLRYVPNTDHSLNNSDADTSLHTFYQAILTGSARPQFSWTLQDDGSIHVQTVNAPTQVNLWQATATEARDFRLETIGAAWTSSPLADQGGGLYIARVPDPPEGWTGFFVELVFNSGGMFPYKFTTEVRVVPNCLPFACKADFDCDRDVDLEDFSRIQVCLTRSGEHYLEGCEQADLDIDNDVDQDDLTKFMQCISGPNVPIERGCAD